MGDSDLGRFLLPARIPETFVLPEDWPLVERYMASKSNPANRQLIVKPEDGSQGDGIFLCNKFRDLQLKLPGGKQAVVQKYVKSPLLLGGLKFDFRIYVLVVGGFGETQQRVYVCREGLARFCTVPYGGGGGGTTTSHDLLGHLTNYSLNKRSDTYVHVQDDSAGRFGFGENDSAGRAGVGPEGKVGTDSKPHENHKTLCPVLVRCAVGMERVCGLSVSVQSWFGCNLPMR